jgi:Ca2+-binding RTX toxin-like protein
VLEGGAGNDTLDGGGGGNDTASYEHAPAGLNGFTGVTVSLAISGPQNTIQAGTDTLINIENLRGSAYNDTLTGNGNSVLEGGPGADHLIGQSGVNDTASYEHATAGVTANLSNSIQNTGDAAGDTYTNIANLFGSRFNDTLIGDNNANVLNGYGTMGNGGDILTGKGGADTFVFGGGNVTVTDFDQGNTGFFNSAEGDKIDLSYSNFGNGLNPADAAAALSALIAASTGDTIDFGNGQVLTLMNVVNISTTLHTADFILHA